MIHSVEFLYSPGDKVILDNGISGVVLSVSESADGGKDYLVEWASTELNVFSRWFHSWQIVTPPMSPTPNPAASIGAAGEEGPGC